MERPLVRVQHVVVIVVVVVVIVITTTARVVAVDVAGGSGGGGASGTPGTPTVQRVQQLLDEEQEGFVAQVLVRCWVHSGGMSVQSCRPKIKNELNHEIASLKKRVLRSRMISHHSNWNATKMVKWVFKIPLLTHTAPQ